MFGVVCWLFRWYIPYVDYGNVNEFLSYLFLRSLIKILFINFKIRLVFKWNETSFASSLAIPTKVVKVYKCSFFLSWILFSLFLIVNTMCVGALYAWMSVRLSVRRHLSVFQFEFEFLGVLPKSHKLIKLVAGMSTFCLALPKLQTL